MYVEAAQCLHDISDRIHSLYQGDQQYSWLINKHCGEIQFPLKPSRGSGFLITSTTAPCSSSSFVPPTDFPIQWSGFHTACGPELGRPVWEKRGGVVASVRGTEWKQRRTRKSGNTEGKAIILEMGQHKSLAFKLRTTSFAVEIVFRSSGLRPLTLHWLEWTFRDFTLELKQSCVKINDLFKEIFTVTLNLGQSTWHLQTYTFCQIILPQYCL